MGISDHDSKAADRDRGKHAAENRPPQLEDFTRDFKPLPSTYGYQPEEQKALFDYFRNVINRKWTVAAVFMVAVAVAAFRAYTAIPIYVSTATVEIEKAGPTNRNMDELVSAFEQFDLYYQTQIETLKSRGLAEAFLARVGKLPPTDAARRGATVEAVPTGQGGSGSAARGVDSWVQQLLNGLGWQSAESPGPSEDAVKSPEIKDGNRTDEDKSELAQATRQLAEVDSVLARVRVNPMSRTQLIQVEMSANDPLAAKKMLAVYLETFVEQSRRRKLELTGKVKTWLSAELAGAKSQLDKSEVALLEFTKQHGIVFADRRSGDAVPFLERAGETYIRSKSDRINLEAASLAKKQGDTEQVGSAYVDNLKSQLRNLQAQYADMKTIYSPNYYKMAFLRSKIKKMEDNLAEYEKKSLATELEAAKQKEIVSEQLYEKTKQEAVGSNSLTVQYEILKKSMDADHQLYSMLLQKSKQSELDQGTIGYNVNVVNPPSLPMSPVYPRKSRMLLLGAILGLLAGIGVAVCLEFFDDTVRTTQEIQRRMKVPILGAVPKIGRGSRYYNVESNGIRPEFMADQFPLSPFTDAIRIIQNSAGSLLSKHGGSVLCISSALPMEGKTLLCVLMATVVASEDKKVLIIDGDMRKGRIHEVFKTPERDTGLSDLLSGKSTQLKKAIKECEIPGVYYMPSGPTPDNPVALTKAPRMKALLDAVKKEFDVVILDSPPLLGVVDARVLCGYADGLILVTRAGHTPVEILSQAKEAVVNSNTNFLGVVLNMSDPRNDGYSYYYTGKYGRYHYHKTQSRSYHA